MIKADDGRAKCGMYTILGLIVNETHTKNERHR